MKKWKKFSLAIFMILSSFSLIISCSKAEINKKNKDENDKKIIKKYKEPNEEPKIIKKIDDKEIIKKDDEIKSKNDVLKIDAKNSDNFRKEFYLPKYEKDNKIHLSVLKNGEKSRNLRDEFFSYSNIDPTGIYLDAGKKYKIKIELNHKPEGDVKFVIRQGANTENDSYLSLDEKEWFLDYKDNEIEIDLTDKKYGYLTYLSNLSEKPISAEIKNLDEVNAPFSKYLFYIHQEDEPENFWHYLNNLKKEDLNSSTFMRISNYDNGGIEIVWSVSWAVKTFIEELEIDSDLKAVDFIKKITSELKIWIDLVNKYDGLDIEDELEVHKPTNLPLLIIGSDTVMNPSNIYAFVNYLHFNPKLISNIFKDTSLLYDWAATHEKGHIIDKKSISIVEVTNNMYPSFTGLSEIKRLIKQGKYEPNVYVNEFMPKYQNGELNQFKYLNDKIQNKQKTFFVEKNKVNGIPFFPMYVWFLTTEFINKFNYNDYPFNKLNDVIFTNDEINTLKKFGAWGALQRLVRNKDQLAKYDTNNLFNSLENNNDMNKFPLLFSIVTGYDFSEILVRFGQENIKEEIKKFTANYPKLNKKIEYYNILAEINNELKYPLLTERSIPKVTFSKNINSDETENIILTISFDEKDVEKSIIAYEIYLDDKLFKIVKPANKITINEKIDNKKITVKAFDYKLNESLLSDIALNENEI
ncbi:hypothetical protein [Mesomycoplasma lagogenitalium]|uniref:Peptidase M60 domain-containing protein n=1 Tax=Mesomycoplasma lagogenitalium TaxID=171286 RepID=A0ABY8LTH9_9BACT|nr:hypothetical protein [Mesomycoplasma lagogenitalium]WGI36546.1 hypothetical protein QEG99_03715 [Mesomycoplasma lagogenitalium]